VFATGRLEDQVAIVRGEIGLGVLAAEGELQRVAEMGLLRQQQVARVVLPGLGAGLGSAGE
jgi:hypothetical protein